MTKVVVTGGSGKLGHHVINELLDHAYEVLSLDKVAPQNPRYPAWIADLRNSGALDEALRADRLSGMDVLLDDPPQDLTLALAQFHAPLQWLICRHFTGRRRAALGVVTPAALP